MTRILLVRHGATDLLGRVLYGRMPGVHLNEDGRKQASVTAQFIKRRYALDEIISSPLERARETAEIIAAEQDLGVTLDDDVTEIDFGSWMGKSFAELHEMQCWHRYNRQRALEQPPGGESMREAQTRAVRTIKRVLESRSDATDQTVAVVSHGDVIRGLLMLFLGMPIEHIHRLEVAPASLSVVNFFPNQQQVVQSINEISY